MKLIITNQIKKYRPDSDQILNNAMISVYEVIRIIKGKALFLNDHYERLRKSLDIQGNSIEMDFSEFMGIIDELIGINSKQEGNIRILKAFSGNESYWEFGFIAHNYPGPDDYTLGVKTELLFAERQNPNVKVIQHTLRERADVQIEVHQLYEVLLVDQFGQITEGSRTNVFLVKDNVFYTAPASQVLIGITRQKVIECIDQLNFQIIEKAVASTEIEFFDAAFLTGTSPKVLPVRTIGEFELNTGLEVVNDIIKAYSRMIDQYISDEIQSGKE